MKIPPPVQALIAAGLMSGLAMMDRQPDMVSQTLAVLFWLFGVAIAVIGVWQFKKQKTTISPMKLDTVSYLVTHGIYAYTRNPMYVGIVIVLIGWGLWLGSLWSLVVVPIFMFTMTHLQIKKEEQALTNLFGKEYQDYLNNVRRWL